MADITIERSEAPLASFYQEKQPWLMQGACVGLHPDLFFNNGTVEPRLICAGCEVRTECGTQALHEEQGKGLESRWGIRAYMTPSQRVSIERRGGLKGRDPMLLVLGQDGRRRIPPTPDEGDRWSRHHTTLARKVVRWLNENVAVGEKLPGQKPICDALVCNPAPLNRVLEALVQDGTLAYAPGAVRKGRTPTGQYVRRRGSHAVGESWLPLHLRDNP